MSLKLVARFLLLSSVFILLDFHQVQCHTLVKRQQPSPGNDIMQFLATLMQSLFPQGGNGGSNFFTNLFGENSNLGQLINAFVQQMQNFLGNITQMWSNTVNRQMNVWNQFRNRSGGGSDREYELVTGALNDMRSAHSEISQITKQQWKSANQRMSEPGEEPVAMPDIHSKAANVTEALRRAWEKMRERFNVTSDITDGLRNLVNKTADPRVVATELQRQLNHMWAQVSKNLQNLVSERRRLLRSGSAGSQDDDQMNEISDTVEVIDKLQKDAETIWNRNLPYVSGMDQNEAAFRNMEEMWDNLRFTVQNQTVPEPVNATSPSGRRTLKERFNDMTKRVKNFFNRREESSPATE